MLVTLTEGALGKRGLIDSGTIHTVPGFSNTTHVGLDAAAGSDWGCHTRLSAPRGVDGGGRGHGVLWLGWQKGLWLPCWKSP